MSPIKIGTVRRQQSRYTQMLARYPWARDGGLMGTMVDGDDEHPH